MKYTSFQKKNFQLLDNKNAPKQDNYSRSNVESFN